LEASIDPRTRLKSAFSVCRRLQALIPASLDTLLYPRYPAGMVAG
jgi:hypothetical protein